MYNGNSFDVFLKRRSQLSIELRRAFFGHESIHGEKDRAATTGLIISPMVTTSLKPSIHRVIATRYNILH